MGPLLLTCYSYRRLHSRAIATPCSRTGQFELKRLETKIDAIVAAASPPSSVTVSPATVRRLRETYDITQLSPRTSKRLEDAYNREMDDRAEHVVDNCIGKPVEGLVQMQGFVNAEGQLQPLSQLRPFSSTGACDSSA